jgi:hypothetical protein
MQSQNENSKTRGMTLKRLVDQHNFYFSESRNCDISFMLRKWHSIYAESKFNDLNRCHICQFCEILYIEKQKI